MPFFKPSFEALKKGIGLRLLTNPPLYMLDIIDISSLFKECISQKCIALYEKGQSLRQISQEVGWSKTTIGVELNKAGLILRKKNLVPASGTENNARGKTGNPPYGFCWLRNQLVVNPKEIETAHLIVKLWQAGTKPNGIVKILTDQKIKSRSHKQWHHSTIKNIINHFKNNEQHIEEIIKWVSAS